MHTIEPFYNWREYYKSEEDENSPLYNRNYNEFELSETIYNYYIHPQWDYIGSPTLYIKILYTDYDFQYIIIELLGEWNDCLHNDIMFLKRNIIDEFTHQGITKFILIGENVLNFHHSDDCYYDEWLDDVNEGWIVFVNFREHVLAEFISAKIDYFIFISKDINNLPWRTFLPQHLFKLINRLVTKRISA